MLYNEKRSIQNSTKIYKRDVKIVAKHTIRILNYNLTLTSDDDKSYIDSVAQRVERNIKTLSDSMPTRNMTEVALFVAMDYCDRYMKAIGDSSAMRSQIKDYLRDTGFARQQLEETKKENERLQAELDKLKERLSAGNAAADIITENLEDTPQSPKKEQPKTTDSDFFDFFGFNPNDEEDDNSTTNDEKKSSESAVRQETPQGTPKPPVKQAKPFPSDSSRKKNGAKGKKKGSKDIQPVKGSFGATDFSESADAVADIMSFFEDKSFRDEDDDDDIF